MPWRKTLHAALAAATFSTALLVGPVPRAASDDWRSLADDEDARRLARLEQAWGQALRQARLDGHRRELAQLGALSRAGGGLADPDPEPGLYRCRTVKMGAARGERPSLVRESWGLCSVELTAGDVLLQKRTGAERPWGRLYADGPRRLVYVGAAAWESGSASERKEQLGAFERIGRDHYRLALPRTARGPVIDLVELKR